MDAVLGVHQDRVTSDYRAVIFVGSWTELASWGDLQFVLLMWAHGWPMAARRQFCRHQFPAAIARLLSWRVR